MASILDKYGIKEVADVMWYNIGDDGEPTTPVLYLDTLKVSTIEQTAEEAEARGGKGNPPLIIWDYGKEINVTLEDALFSAKSMAILFGGSYSKKKNASEKDRIRKTFSYVATSAEYVPAKWSSNLGDFDIGADYVLYDETGKEVTKEEVVKDSTYFVSFYVKIKEVTEIEISPNTFPGNYYITGDTYARAQKNGKDEFFQFIIPNAKVQSEQTLTLEAEGDPTVFNLNLRVLRPANGGGMMKLVKYNIDTDKPEEETGWSYPILQTEGEVAKNKAAKEEAAKTPGAANLEPAVG